MPSGVPGSGPAAFGRQSMKQITVRVDRKKVDELYRMLREEALSLQKFLSIAIDAYIESDSRMRGLIEAFRRDEKVSEEERDSGQVFSEKERAAILREIDR